MSQNLAATLARASDAARAAGTGEVALEHVLLALCDDPDAEAVLHASQVDIAHLKSDAIEFIRTLPVTAPGAPLIVSGPLTRILEAAAAAARGGRRRDINGAIVLAAIVGDGRSTAAELLQMRGLTFDEAIRALQAALAPPSRDAVPDLRPADDVLAQARQRVQSRSAPSLRDMMHHAPPRSEPSPPPAVPQHGPASQHAAFDHMQPESEAAETEPRPPTKADLQAASQEAAGNDEADAVPAAAQAPSDKAAGAMPAAPAKKVAAGEPPAPANAQKPAPPAYTYPVDAGGMPRPPQQPPQGQPPFQPPRSPPVQNQSGQNQPGQNNQPGPAPHHLNIPRPAPVATPPPIPPPMPGAPPGMGGMPPMRGAPPRGPQPSAIPGAPPPPGQMPQGGPIPHGLSPHGPAPHSPGPQGLPPQTRQQPPRPGGPMPPPGNAPAGPNAPAARGTPPSQAPSMPPQTRGGPQAAAKPQRSPKAATELGQLAENIPRRMRVGVTERIEIRLAKASAKAVAEGLEGGGQAWVHQVTVAKAMSVRLRAPDGGFFIETASPETQWIENNLGFDSDDFASWRFLVTPQERGWADLQIIVSARTIGADGMAAETALPDQVVEVKVRTNYKRTILRWIGWIIAAVIGGALAKFGEGGFDSVAALVQKLLN